MTVISIKGRLIGSNSPVFIIAEAGDNHLGSLEVAKEMAMLAKLAGADAVKYQHHLPDEEMLTDVPTSDNMREPLYEFLKRSALSLGQHVALHAYCNEIGIQYMCTPFSFKAAEEMMDAGLLDVIKIGSGEMTDIPSIKRMTSFGVPLILSTGMCDFDEIKNTYDVMVNSNRDFALLNCVSEYPPQYDDINLGVIPRMINEFPRAVIGHSDHTPTNYTAFAAVVNGARIVEKHVIISRLTPGPDQSVSLEFPEFHDLVKGIRIIESASGASKKVHDREKAIRSWAYRSVVATRQILAGERIEVGDVWTKRPGTGIPSKDIDKVVGCIAKVDIPKNSLVKWDQLSSKD